MQAQTGLINAKCWGLTAISGIGKVPVPAVTSRDRIVTLILETRLDT